MHIYLVIVSAGIGRPQLVVQVHSLRGELTQDCLYLFSYELQEMIDGVHSTITNVDTLGVCVGGCVCGWWVCVCVCGWVVGLEQVVGEGV